jgi:hypothetical protein
MRKGSMPVKTIETARILAKCVGWENGIAIDEIAKAIYGDAGFHSKAKARQLIGRVRVVLNVDIFSTKPYGRPERRYFHHVTVDEYNEAIDDFEKQIQRLQVTETKLQTKKKTAEARLRLRLAQKKRTAKKTQSSK